MGCSRGFRSREKICTPAFAVLTTTLGPPGRDGKRVIRVGMGSKTFSCVWRRTLATPEWSHGHSFLSTVFSTSCGSPGTYILLLGTSPRPTVLSARTGREMCPHTAFCSKDLEENRSEVCFFKTNIAGFPSPCTPHTLLGVEEPCCVDF